MKTGIYCLLEYYVKESDSEPIGYECRDGRRSYTNLGGVRISMGQTLKLKLEDQESLIMANRLELQ